MFVGERNHHRKQFQGHMREFSADAGNPTFEKCPNLDLMLASPVVTSVEETSTTTQQPLSHVRMAWFHLAWTVTKADVNK